MQLTNSKTSSDKIFLSILSDGKFHKEVPEDYVAKEGEEVAVREYEDSNGVKKTKNELLMKDIVGKITSISLLKGNFGENLLINIDDEASISIGINSYFCEDLMEKIPALDLSKEVRLSPYSFIPKGKKSTSRGVTVYQNDEKYKWRNIKEENNAEKISSYFWDYIKKQAINGAPTKEDNLDYKTTKGKVYLLQKNEFLVEQIKMLPVFKVIEVVAEKEAPLEIPGF